MKPVPLSAAVRQFLTEAVASVERLDLLLFLHRQPSQWWAAERLAEDLEMPVDAAQSHLEHLAAGNLLDVRIAESVIYCYKPARQELSRVVEEVARLHYFHRDALAAVLAGRSADSARLFADAFKLRKGKQDG